MDTLWIFSLVTGTDGAGGEQEGGLVAVEQKVLVKKLLNTTNL